MQDLKRKSTDSPAPAPSPLLDDGFTKVQKRKQRKVERHRPQFQFDTSYFRSGKKIGIAHIRDLSLYLAADAQRPSWIVVDNPSFVSHTVVVMVSGLLPGHLGLPNISPAACLPFQTTPSVLADVKDLPKARVPAMSKLFAYGCPTRAPGDSRKLHSVMNTLLHCPLPDSIKKKREAESKRLLNSHKNGGSTPLLYLCAPNQMAANGYRLPSYVEPSGERFIPGDVPPELAEILDDKRTAEGEFGEPATTASMGPRPVVVDDQGRRRKGNVRGEEGWVETPQAKGLPPSGVYPVLAMDCEMVLSEDGQELARVSVVDLESGENVFDELVTPPKPVTDYLTQFSGMTKERMATATHTFESIQEALVTGPDPIITPHTILLGHSLDCDLAVLKIRHPLVIDTTVIYKHARGPPYKPSLKWLTQKWLGRAIQNHEGGHDSAEDARACIDLLKMKLQFGPEFGDPGVESETIFERVGRYRPNGKTEPKTSLVVDYGNPSGWYGSKATKAVAATTDDGVIDAITQDVSKYDYVYARLTELSNLQHWNSTSGGAVDLSEVDEEELDAALERLDARLTRLHGSLPENTALILLTGHSDPREMLALSARRTKWERAFQSKGDGEELGVDERWSTEDDRELERMVAETREGMAFFCVK